VAANVGVAGEATFGEGTSGPDMDGDVGNSEIKQTDWFINYPSREIIILVSCF
jgi:hypothetical protein